MKIIPTKGCDSEGKRMHVPAIVEVVCPKCGCAYKRDYSHGDHYFSYPAFNTPITLNLYCPECLHEWVSVVQINLSLTAIEKIPCHECGRDMIRDVRPCTIRYQDRSAEIQQPGFYCTGCAEVVLVGDDGDRADNWLRRLQREAAAEGTPK